MVSMVDSDSSHLDVQASFMSLVSVSISTCISFMHPACLPYHSRLTPCTHSPYHFSFPVKSMLATSMRIVALTMVTISGDNNENYIYQTDFWS